MYPIRKHENLSRLADAGYASEVFLGKLSCLRLPPLTFGLPDSHKLVDSEGTDISRKDYVCSRQAMSS